MSSSEPRLYEPNEIIGAIDRGQRKRIDHTLKFGQERELKELSGIEVQLEDFEGRDLISLRLDAICERSRRIDTIKACRYGILNGLLPSKKRPVSTERFLQH
jgi:hypothetical protein